MQLIASVSNEQRIAMLADPLNIPLPTDPDDSAVTDALTTVNVGGALNTAIVDVSPGASTRTFTDLSGIKWTLGIKHSQTKENAPFVTDRTLVRLDRVEADTNSGQLVTSSAYFVVANPLGSTAGTLAETLRLVRALALFALMGDCNSSGVMTDANAGTLQRILNGEP